jgi:restriction system protein
MGVLSSDRNASKGVISTTSDFAPKLADDPFIKPLLPHRIELVNGEQLLVRLQQHARGS